MTIYLIPISQCYFTQYAHKPNANIPNSIDDNNQFDANFHFECLFYVQGRIGEARKHRTKQDEMTSAVNKLAHEKLSREES